MKMGSMQCRHCQRWHPSAEMCGCEGEREANVRPMLNILAAKKREKLTLPTPDMAAFRADFLKLMDRHAGALDAAEMMALAAYTVGQIMAMQDARKWTPELAMEVVAKNIEIGNAQAISEADKWMPKA